MSVQHKIMICIKVIKRAYSANERLQFKVLNGTCFCQSIKNQCIHKHLFCKICFALSNTQSHNHSRLHGTFVLLQSEDFITDGLANDIMVNTVR